MKDSNTNIPLELDHYYCDACHCKMSPYSFVPPHCIYCGCKRMIPYYTVQKTWHTLKIGLRMLIGLISISVILLGFPWMLLEIPILLLLISNYQKFVKKIRKIEQDKNSLRKYL